MSTTQAFPPGGTYFDNAKRSFTQVPINASKDNAISTTEFLEASESLTGLFDVLGSVAFNPVKSDMSGNIKVCTACGTWGDGNGSLKKWEGVVGRF